MCAKISKKTFPFIFILLSLGIFSQQAIAQEQDIYEYNREFVWGISKNTNSGLIAGLAGKFGRRLSSNEFQTLGLEIVNVKHPKELRRVSRLSGNTFILGKVNYLFSVRPQYGREWILFNKAPQQGVQVTAIFAGGPTLGVVMPYYVQVAEGSRTRVVRAEDSYNNNVRGDIIGSGPFLKGIGDSNLQIGANIKASLAFEFGTFKNDVTGFEAGFQLEAFPKEIPLVPSVENRSIYPSAFIMLFYGYRR